jgi:Cyclin, N-terminal domain
VQTVPRRQLQLVGVAALFIASKYEELYPPEINDYVFIADDAYTKQQILDMEKQIVRVSVVCSLVSNFCLIFLSSFRFSTSSWANRYQFISFADTPKQPKLKPTTT